MTPPYPNGVVFNFSVDCYNPNNTSAPHFVQTGTITSGSSGMVFGVMNPPVGWMCQVTETVPSGTDAAGCYWSPGVAITPNPVTIQSGPNNLSGFKNNYICPSVSALYDLDVIKLPSARAAGGEVDFLIIVQNVGTQTLTSTDLGSGHLKIIDNLPAGTTILPQTLTANLPDWNCLLNTSVPVAQQPQLECIYQGGASLTSGAALPPIKVFAIPTNNQTTYFSPANNAVQTVGTATRPLNCVVQSLTGTGGTPDHDDRLTGNSQACTSF
jgi:uncharacterized repeat protein (TIGR01451 family)